MAYDYIISTLLLVSLSLVLILGSLYLASVGQEYHTLQD